MIHVHDVLAFLQCRASQFGKLVDQRAMVLFRNFDLSFHNINTSEVMAASFDGHFYLVACLFHLFQFTVYLPLANKIT